MSFARHTEVQSDVNWRSGFSIDTVLGRLLGIYAQRGWKRRGRARRRCVRLLIGRLLILGVPNRNLGFLSTSYVRARRISFSTIVGRQVLSKSIEAEAMEAEAIEAEAMKA